MQWNNFPAASVQHTNLSSYAYSQLRILNYREILLLIHLHIWKFQASKDVRWKFEWLTSQPLFSKSGYLHRAFYLFPLKTQLVQYCGTSHQVLFQVQNITQSSLSWIRIELHRFSPDELLYIFFSKWWLLKIKAERHWADRLLIDIMKRCQVRVAQCLINCKQPDIKVIFIENNEGKQLIKSNEQNAIVIST